MPKPNLPPNYVETPLSYGDHNTDGSYTRTHQPGDRDLHLARVPMRFDEYPPNTGRTETVDKDLPLVAAVREESYTARVDPRAAQRPEASLNFAARFLQWGSRNASENQR